MNREIKFRVWENKNFIFFNLKNINYIANIFNKFYSKNFDNMKFTQYIGLKDVNGVEIYEGDIVKSMEFGGINFEIIWDNDNACFVGENNSIKGMGICLNETIKYPMYNLQFGKIIGNIYENPELLEGNN